MLKDVKVKYDDLTFTNSPIYHYLTEVDNAVKRYEKQAAALKECARVAVYQLQCGKISNMQQVYDMFAEVKPYTDKEYFREMKFYS